MEKADYIADLETRLREVDRNIERLTALLDGADVPGKMQALDDLVHLCQRHEDLQRKIADAKVHGASDWSTLHTSFQEGRPAR